MAAQFDSRAWGGLAFRGVLAILFGILAFARPGNTILALAGIVGVIVGVISFTHPHVTVLGSVTYLAIWGAERRLAPSMP